ncbi:hypothetical protein [Blastopirellula retiformator]|uniref:hypothetical protein n=1 Tax=Blastopirellula retiformator TaxID=2527970 RepID=UPI0011B8369F|nr:hypothetical protein [Blastopirellula retiformator]
MKPPKLDNAITTYRWDFLVCLRMFGSHCFAWLVVGSYERVAAFAINDRRLIFFFVMVETAALACRSFVRLFSAVVLLHVVGLITLFYGADPNPTHDFQFAAAVNFWLWPELSLPGWVFLIWMLSPPETTQPRGLAIGDREKAGKRMTRSSDRMAEDTAPSAASRSKIRVVVSASSAEQTICKTLASESLALANH